MRYLKGYVFYCLTHTVMMIAESIMGDCPYREDSYGEAPCRPQQYKEYVKFRRLQNGESI